MEKLSESARKALARDNERATISALRMAEEVRKGVPPQKPMDVRVQEAIIDKLNNLN